MRSFGESKRAHEGVEGGAFYAEDLVTAKEEKWNDKRYEHIIRASEMVWEDSPQGRLKHVAHPRINPHVKDIEAYIQELPPDGRSGKHRHMAEEFIFVLEGRGYSLHWDIDLALGDKYGWDIQKKPRRFEWQAGDWEFVPVNTVHQHFNLDGSAVARLMCVTSRIYKLLGWHDLEQIEDAPRPDATGGRP
jgi:quercetin dioxygenase-like cupin family protein